MGGLDSPPADDAKRSTWANDRAGPGGSSTTPGSGGPGAQPAAPPGQDKPVVIYRGYLQLSVRQLRQAQDAIVAMTEKAGGYVESLTGRVAIVRVPASDFEAVMAIFATVGRVLDRQVSALDVTARYTDLKTRLAVATATRDRLLALLERSTDPDERLAILQEVKRLSEQIETIESTLGTLKNLADLYTITIELIPVNETSAPRGFRSPFPWVRQLVAHQQTVGEGKDDVEIELPKGFVSFEEDHGWRAQASDTTTIRAGFVANEPLGTSAFWAKAVELELIEGRDEALVESGERGKLVYRIARTKDLEPRYWLVAVGASQERVYVVEAFFPDADAYLAHKDGVLDALASFRTQ